MRNTLGYSLSYVRVSVCLYACILSPAKFASSVNSNLNHVYQLQIISLDLIISDGCTTTRTIVYVSIIYARTRMETTHGPTSSNDNSDGGYCMTTKTTSS